MKVVYNWLKDFVDVTATPQELASRLALSGTNIGGVENGAHGAVIEAEVSSNRPDCLGHLGIAREVAAIYRLSLKHVAPKPAEGAAKAGDAIKVEIQSPELCGRFTARVIRNVKIQPSPKWLKDRLEASGVASIATLWIFQITSCSNSATPSTLLITTRSAITRSSSAKRNRVKKSERLTVSNASWI